MISVVCPVYNEEKYIEKVLSFFVNAAPAEKELLVIDGNSTDRTREIVLQWSVKYPSIRVLENPGKYVPFALNLAIPACKGDIIVRLDAHTEYASDYFTCILDAFRKSGADIVGGPMRAVGNSTFQKAVAYCTSTRFGVGDSSFHDSQAEGFTESVYLGAWKSRIFPITGAFDEQMLRNQDDEFHYRAKSRGMKIYLDPAIRSWYYPRDSAGKLFSQYFQYGHFKPLVLKKVFAGLRIRHLIPSFFVLYLIAVPFVANLFGWPVFLPLLAYLMIDLAFTLKGKAGWNERCSRFVVYPLLHLAYGLGFLSGIGKKNRLVPSNRIKA